MSYDVIHLLQVWLLPPGLILLLMLIALVASLRSPRLGKGILLFTFILFWLISTPLFTEALYKPLENQYKPLDVRTLTQKERTAIVVLGAGVASESTFKRTRYAAALHRKTNSPIITSGGNRGKGTTEAEAMRRDLFVDYHVPTLAMEDQSRNTMEESVNLLPLLKANHISKIYLVTHAYHMPRSMLAFTTRYAKSGIEITPSPTAYISLMSSHGLANILPQAYALDASVAILHEYLGLIWYKIYT